MSLSLTRVASAKLNFTQTKKKLLPIAPSSVTVRCINLQQAEQQVEAGIICEPCNGTGWVLCDFCEGQKTSVKAANNRIYRRCPSCRAIGYILCSKCKVFRCVTFPNDSDGQDLTF